MAEKALNNLVFWRSVMILPGFHDAADRTVVCGARFDSNSSSILAFLNQV